MEKRSKRPEVLAAIDVGTNAVRLELARPLPDGSLETLHQERDPVRPGEGVFATGSMPRAVADRLLSTLRRYAALCRRDGALVRAVATSAVREARNRDEIVRRVREEAGLDLEVVSGREEARLICLGVLHGRPKTARSLVIDIGGGSTEVALARGEHAVELFSVAVGAVRLTEMFGTASKVTKGRLALLRSYASEAFREGLPRRLAHPVEALGASGTINAVVGFAASKGRSAQRKQIARASEELASMGLEERRRHFDPNRAEIVVGGAVILETLLDRLGLKSVTSVDTGLRNGVLIDLFRRTASAEPDDRSGAEAALALGRRFDFDEKHGLQVGAIAVTLFEDLATLHGLPHFARRILEAAAVLHDLGNAVAFHKHHKHTFYLVANADMPGFSERERELVATVARYHRRSTPDRKRADLSHFSASELTTVRKLSALLRVANALDASHRQPVRGLRARLGPRAVTLHLRVRDAADLELWDVAREAAFFREVFRKPLEVLTRRGQPGR
ncbi:MAG TPA: Ppx/GppA phosphatase family protein [Anaeromyxobacteraceae bacterium]|nr:Ppx/GppA phosphatase family protein [Anaeromyxobacteraceae bacterium]